MVGELNVGRRPRSPRSYGRRIVMCLALGQVVVGALAASGISHRSHALASASTAEPLSRRPVLPSLKTSGIPRGPTATTTTVSVDPPTPTGVGTVTLDLYDPTRPTVFDGRVLAPSRHLPTIVRYPAVGPRGAGEQLDAPPASGLWPLVVFAHGYDVTPDTYSHLLHVWASAGFVVAAPVFPLEGAGGPLDESDLVHEPADIAAVISALLQRSAASSGPLAGLIDPHRIAVVGHSDGAVAALGAAFGLGDARIGPVIAIAGAASAGVPHPNPHHPLLVVQGTDDNIDNPANSYRVYSAAGRPRILLELLGAGHLPPVADDTPWRPIVEAVTIDFLRHYFGQDPTFAPLSEDGAHPGLSLIGGEV